MSHSSESHGTHDLNIAMEEARSTPDKPAREALIEDYARGTFAARKTEIPLDVYRQQFREFADAITALRTPAEETCETCHGTGHEARHSICRDCDDTTPPVDEAKVRVKPLEFTRSWGPDEDGDESHRAGTPFGSYTVEKQNNRWRWRYCFDEYYDEGESDCATYDEGVAAAQAHWLERISPVFSPAPAVDEKQGEGR